MQLSCAMQLYSFRESTMHDSLRLCAYIDMKWMSESVSLKVYMYWARVQDVSVSLVQ